MFCPERRFGPRGKWNLSFMSCKPWRTTTNQLLTQWALQPCPVSTAYRNASLRHDMGRKAHYICSFWPTKVGNMSGSAFSAECLQRGLQAQLLTWHTSFYFIEVLHVSCLPAWGLLLCCWWSSHGSRTAALLPHPVLCESCAAPTLSFIPKCCSVLCHREESAQLRWFKSNQDLSIF